MRLTILIAIVLWLNYSCKTLQADGTDVVSNITLGAIGTENTGLFTHTFETIGKPVLTEDLLLSVVHRPANQVVLKQKEAKAKSELQKTEKSQGVDSIQRPYLMTLGIADRIALRSLLNLPENQEIRTYWAQSKELRIISEITFHIKAPEKEEIMQAEALFLTLDQHGQLTIMTKGAGEESQLNIPTASIQDFKTWSACWGKDRYGNIIMEVLNEAGQNCPEGTGKTKDKIPSDNPYLKL